MNRPFFLIDVFFILTLVLGGLFVMGDAPCGQAGETVISGPYCAAEQMTPTASGEVEKMPVEIRVAEELFLAAAAWLLLCLTGILSAGQGQASLGTPRSIAGFASWFFRRTHQPFLSARAP